MRSTTIMLNYITKDQQAGEPGGGLSRYRLKSADTIGLKYLARIVKDSTPQG
jgi:hypothetical protein